MRLVAGGPNRKGNLSQVISGRTSKTCKRDIVHEITIGVSQIENYLDSLISGKI